MKIIAKIEEAYRSRALLVQMSAEELSLLVHCSEHRDSHVFGLPVGTELKINDRYSRLRELENNREQLDKAIQQLRAVATVIEPLLPIVDCPKPPAQSEGGDQVPPAGE